MFVTSNLCCRIGFGEFVSPRRRVEQGISLGDAEECELIGGCTADELGPSRPDRLVDPRPAGSPFEMRWAEVDSDGVAGASGPGESSASMKRRRRRDEHGPGRPGRPGAAAFVLVQRRAPGGGGPTVGVVIIW